MVDPGSIDPVDSLSLRLQAISAGGWANIQTPVREAFEASAATARRLAAELTASRDEVKRLETRLAGLEDSFSRRLENSARDVRVEVDNMRTTVNGTPSLADVRTLIDEACRCAENTMIERVRVLECETVKIMRELRKGLESVRQASAGKAALSDLEAFYPRAEAAARSDLLELEGRLAKKADKEAMDASLATKVPWPDLERLLRAKADAAALDELEKTCATRAALERVELDLSRAVGMEEVRAFVEIQTGDIQAMSPALKRLLTARGREEREAAENGPASWVARSEIAGLVRATLRDVEKDDEERGGCSARVTVSQLQAAACAGRESTLRTVDAQLARARGAQQEQAQTQEKRIRGELDEAVGRVRVRVDALDRGLETAKAELVNLVNKKAYKTDVALALQGKADTRELEAAMALVRSKVDDSHHKETYTRTVHELAVLSAEIGGARRELRADLERVSGKLLTKADTEDVLAMRRALTAVNDVNVVAHRRPLAMTPVGSVSGTGGGGGEADVGDGGIQQQQQQQRRQQQQQQQQQQPREQNSNPPGTAKPWNGRVEPVKTRASGGANGGGLSREEARLLIRAELKRAGMSEKITREEALVMAEGSVTKALFLASRETEATDLRLRELGDRLAAWSGMASESEIRRLLSVQSTLEARVVRSISVGRWLWHGTAMESAASSTRMERDTGDGGIWVPWNVEAANACPQCLLWEAGGTAVTAVAPGLYLLSCGFFSSTLFSATVFLNGSPLCTFPGHDGHPLATFGTPREDPVVDCSGNAPFQQQGVFSSDGTLRPAEPIAPAGNSSQPHAADSSARGSRVGGGIRRENALPEEESRLGRCTHPMGEVLARSVREFVVLPAGGVVGVKFERRGRSARGVDGRGSGELLPANAQGFLELQKL